MWTHAGSHGLGSSFSFSEKPASLCIYTAWVSVELRILPEVLAPSLCTPILGGSFSLLICGSQGLQCSCAQPSSKPNECMEELLIMVPTENTEVPSSIPTSGSSVPPAEGAPISNSLTATAALRRVLQGPRFLFLSALFWLRPQEQYWLGVGVAHLLLAIITFSPVSPVNCGVSDWILMGLVWCD